MQGLLSISGSRRNTTNGGGGGATEDRNIQCKNITQRRPRVSCPYVDRLSLTGSRRLNAHIWRLAN